MSTPTEKLAESIGHDCQTGCGNIADVVVVQLATGEVDIMCAPCNLAMMMAVIQTLEGMPPTADDSETDAAVSAATEAARAALAAD